MKRHAGLYPDVMTAGSVWVIRRARTASRSTMPVGMDLSPSHMPHSGGRARMTPGPHRDPAPASFLRADEQAWLHLAFERRRKPLARRAYPMWAVFATSGSPGSRSRFPVPAPCPGRFSSERFHPSPRRRLPELGMHRLVDPSGRDQVRNRNEILRKVSRPNCECPDGGRRGGGRPGDLFPPPVRHPPSAPAIVSLRPSSFHLPAEVGSPSRDQARPSGKKVTRATTAPPTSIRRHSQFETRNAFVE